MNTQQIRRAFLNYFKSNNHTLVSSSPVVPHDDPTLLFTNAGMNQFKDVFLGTTLRDYKRAATSQKCVRVGGKHNDLENVGHTSRHLTFFEMLGNFSFGDYFKKDAIRFAWEVSTDVFQLDPERIWPTVFREDDEAFELWQAYVPQNRITRFDEKDNFWAMGETGPCGPCSELLYDRGSLYGSAKSPKEDLSGERFLEFWNLVFMQFNKDATGKIIALPKPSIDTGAGLERIISLKMDVESVFETDILRALIDQVEQLSGITYQSSKAPAFRVIADHMRLLSFAIADGVQPSNVDRGYVLRKVLRRAVRYGKQLGFENPFLGKILPRLIETMGHDYPELVNAKALIEEVLTLEEESFFKTLKRGGNLLNQIIERSKSHKLINGDDAFKLKDTYGLPFEEIVLIAKDADLTVDKEKFDRLEIEARERSKSVHKTTQQTASQSVFEELYKEKGATKFLGYTSDSAPAKLLAILKEGEFVDQLNEGEEGLLLLDQTPFYAEMGGQVGDTGKIESEVGIFQVMDTKAPFKGLIGHLGKVSRGFLRLGNQIKVSIDLERRQSIQNNHTATHLLHWALQNILGSHIKQAGSIVDDLRLRFDFNHHKSLSQIEIRKIEESVNHQIRENHEVKTEELPFEEIRERSDIKQFFGEKYGAFVRVVEAGHSKELCGGTHTSQTGDIGYFRIVKEGSIAAGVRRIEAVTGKSAEQWVYESEDSMTLLAQTLKCTPLQLKERIEKLLDDNKNALAQLKKIRQQELLDFKKQLQTEKEMLRDVSLITKETTLSIEEMRDLSEQLVSQQPLAIILLATTQNGKASLYLRISDDLVKKGLNAQAIIRDLAPLIGGSGGGKAESATAGGTLIEKIPLALLKIRDYAP